MGPDLTHNGGSDGFVAKVKADGTGLVYAGYIGGADLEEADAIAVDTAGNAYVAGLTESDETTFPVRVGPDLTFNGIIDAFVAKVKPDGTGLLFAGYIGGAGDDEARGIAVDPAGNVFIAGVTNSSEPSLPVTVGPDLIYNGQIDAFAAKVSGKPDLADSFLTIPSVAKRGGSFAVTSKAFNLALGTAPASTTRYYLSLDNAKSTSDILMTGNKAVAILQPGANVQGGATVTIPNSTALGSYFVLACADDTHAIAELDENNNCFPSVARMTVTLPDLRVTGMSAPQNASPGNGITVSDAVRNFGLVGAGGSTTRYYLSTDTVKSNNDVLLTGSRAVPALEPQQDSGFSVSVTIPSNTALGAYHLIACADDTHVVAETDENNNCLAFSGITNLAAPAFAPPVELKSSGRVATVTVLATCTDGAQVHLTVSITQGNAFGEGKGVGKCTGNPGRYPVTVPAQGPTSFEPGPAQVSGKAIVKDHGEVLDDHTWTRVLNLVQTP